MKWTEAELSVIRQYYQTLTYAQLATLLPGRTEPAVRTRVYLLGLGLHEYAWSPTDTMALVEAYEAHVGKRGGWLKAFAVQHGRLISNVCRKAKELGLQRSYTRKVGITSEKTLARLARQQWTEEEWATYRSDRAKQQILENGHPRGYLGHIHSPETRKKLSEAGQRNRGTTRTEAQRQAISESNVNRLETSPTSIYSGAKRGRRSDLNNLFVRSAYEANYARYLNFIKEPWAYEVKTFWFEGIQRGTRSYTPDFWLPEKQEYHEVKGWMDQKSRTKLDRMARYYPEIRIIVIDSTFFKDIERKRLCAIIPGWECSHQATKAEWERMIMEREKKDPG